MRQEAPTENGSRPKAESNGHHSVGGYRLLREIDTDSLGSVYEAEHPRLHRRVALRTIGTGVARDVSFSRRFLLELRSYTALEHEAIPRLYELAYEGEQHGFRQAENIRRTFEGELYFLSRIFGFETADEIEPVQIENFYP